MDVRKTVIATFVVAASLTPLMAFAVEAETIKKDIKEAPHEVAIAAKDTAITAKVKALFAMESDIPSLKISVATKDHVVYLEGNVDTTLQASKMIQIAQGVSGVTKVNSTKLTTTSSDSYFKDAFITARVKGKIFQLANDGAIDEHYDLDVETTNGVVHIFGRVAKKKDISVVESMASKVEDVTKVKTNIDVVKR